MYDCIIIGAGPAGMNAALYAKRAGLKVLIYEKICPGGQMVNATNIENYLGFDKIDGADLSMKMYAQIKDIPYEKKEVIDIESLFSKTKNIIIATGSSPKKPDFKGYELGKYCAVCDGFFYKGKDVFVVGGGNTAIKSALYLSNIVNKVYMVVRKNEFRTTDILEREIFSNKKIKVLFNEEIVEYSKDFVKLKNQTFNKGEYGLFICIGSVPNTSSFNVNKNESGYIITNEFMETSLKNVFAIGDCREKHTRQIITAANDGAIAIDYIANNK